MKTIGAALLLTVAMMMQTIPTITAEIPIQENSNSETAVSESAVSEVPDSETITPESAAASCYYDETIPVRLLDKNGIETLTLHDYLIHVVLQEMPASFETEALKAQAVAARTFTMERIYEGGRHEDADVCGDSTCCQCYLDEQEGREIYGDGYDAAWDKVREAVEGTDGQVITYGDELIEAAYFSSTGGSTESAASVWGGDVPYLQPVSSPETPSVEEVTVSFADFQAALPEAALEGEPAGWFGAVTYTEGGAVETMVIGGATYSGTTLRSRFSLRSARFTAAVTEEGISFETTGSGHGVGLSQYGADEMARTGSSYRDILTHYYTGTEIKQLY